MRIGRTHGMERPVVIASPSDRRPHGCPCFQGFTGPEKNFGHAFHTPGQGTFTFLAYPWEN